MTVTLSIDIDNDAFADDWRQEFLRIANEAVEKIATDVPQRAALRDINGNVVGIIKAEGRRD